MSDNASEATETVADDTIQQNEQQAETKPTETVDFWKTKAREQERRAKENAAAAKELAEIKDAQKSDAEKAADRIAKAEAESASVPTKVADALRTHLVALHGIDAEDAELFLTATDPDLLLKQVERLVGQSDKRKKQNHVPREGQNQAPAENDMHAFARELFGGAQ
ncbi:hypothetical protein A5780_19230 [Nocardia sp. 852002-20019_SCH5090214]|uniref:hypothetical protein n=1 Tax=Nocardia sp. 852002-20019_SCH5090214 TaxID=1834087 RepID=UPI0007EB3F7C|nr:hypothetical protein [Nocardia sp. 852002-20019_SCH5090214]OBA62193.1 hypothetical protein A5780_19230 [Nocardia sp. 852002-20019_SCH5090214]